MKRNISIVTLLLGAVLLLGGCVDFNNKSGRLIHFTTSTGEVGTKTVYGPTVDSYQRIEWVKNDEIFVVSDLASCIDGVNAGKHYATYVIDGVSNEGHLSYATIAPQPNGLTWGEDQYYDFYAATPAPKQYSVQSIYGPDDLPEEPAAADYAKIGTATCFILQNQTTSGSTTSGGTTTFAPNMFWAPMTAAASHVDKNATEDVSLVFYPAFTAIEVTMTSDEPLRVNKVELSSSDVLAGTYSFKAGTNFLTDTNPITVADNSRYNSVNISGLNQAISSDAGINFTLFIIPKVNTSAVTLNIYTQTGSGSTLTTHTASLALKYKDGTVLQFQPGQKYRINALKLNGQWKILFEVDVDEWIELAPSTSLIVE